MSASETKLKCNQEQVLSFSCNKPMEWKLLNHLNSSLDFNYLYTISSSIKIFRLALDCQIVSRLSLLPPQLLVSKEQLDYQSYSIMTCRFTQIWWQLMKHTF